MLRVALILLLQAIAVYGAITLTSYNISDVTVSGLSSGAYMAVQFHVIHSEIISGAAIFAGGPFYCAEGNLNNAEYKCMATYMGVPNVPALQTETWTLATQKKIDNPDHMKNDRIFLFSGTADTVVDPKVMKALQQYYEGFVDVSNIVADYSVKAQHCQPTLDQGNSCAMLASPYIGKCQYDGAGIALQVLFGDLNPRATQIKGNLFEFNQKSFVTTTNSDVGDTGYIYIPTACQDHKTSCRLHLSFHGCKQDLKSIGNLYASESGYNEWAESNNIIVVYPYAVSSKSRPSNPNGCWDWWGYTDANYATKSGKQIQFIKAVVDKLTGTK